LFRVKNRGKSYGTCAVSFSPIFGYLNKLCLTILDNTELTVVKKYITKLLIQLKDDRMSSVLKNLMEKFKGVNLIARVIGLQTSPSDFIIKVR